MPQFAQLWAYIALTTQPGSSRLLLQSSSARRMVATSSWSGYVRESSAKMKKLLPVNEVGEMPHTTPPLTTMEMPEHVSETETDLSYIALGVVAVGVLLMIASRMHKKA